MYKIKVGQLSSGKVKLTKIEVIDENDAVIEMRTASTPLQKGQIINSLKEFYGVDDVIDPINIPKPGRKRGTKVKSSVVPVVEFTSPVELDKYFEANPEFFWERALVAISEGIANKKTVVSLFILGDTKQKLTANRNEWVSGLNLAKEYFDSVEKFEKSSICKALLLKLNQEE